MPTLQRHTHLQAVFRTVKRCSTETEKALDCFDMTLWLSWGGHRQPDGECDQLYALLGGEHCVPQIHVVLLQKYTKTLRLYWRRRQGPLHKGKRMSWRTSRCRWEKLGRGRQVQEENVETTAAEQHEWSLERPWRPSLAREVQTTAGDQQRTGDFNTYFCRFEQLSLLTNLTSESITPSSSYSNKLLLTWRGLGAPSESCSLTSPVLSTPSRLNYWGDMLEVSGVDQHLTSWSKDHVTNCSPFLFTLYIADFGHNSCSCHLRKFSDNLVISFIKYEDEMLYRGYNRDYMDWCHRNHLQLNVRKPNELVVALCGSPHSLTPVNIRWKDIEMA